MGSVILEVALVDCEQLRGGLLAQPANSLSSLAFVVAGVWILVRAQRHIVNLDAIAVGLASLAVGVGSFAFHGIAGAQAHWLHDTTLLTLLGLVAVEHVGPRGLCVARAAPIVVVFAGTSVFASPNSTTLVAVVLVLCVAASEVAAPWRNRVRIIPGPLATMLAGGLCASWLGRTGSVLCRPESVLQLHALWHLVMAAATVWWVECAVLDAPAGPNAVIGSDARGEAVTARR